MATLQAALALAEVDGAAVGVGQHLHLDVPGPVDPAFEQQRVVAEGGAGHPARGLDLGLEVRRVADQPHALAAAAGRGLQQDGVADRGGGGREFGVGRGGVLAAGHHRDAGAVDGLLGIDLVAHQLDG